MLRTYNHHKLAAKKNKNSESLPSQPIFHKSLSPPTSTNQYDTNRFLTIHYHLKASQSTILQSTVPANHDFTPHLNNSRYLTHQSPETVISQLPITTNDTQFTHKCDCNCCIIAAQCCNCARNPILALPSRMKVTYGDTQHVDVQRCSHLQWLLRKCCAKTTLEVCRASI